VSPGLPALLAAALALAEPGAAAAPAATRPAARAAAAAGAPPLADVDGPEALWRLLGAEAGWPAADAVRPGAPLAGLLATLPGPPGVAWRRRTCQSGETVYGRAASAGGAAAGADAEPVALEALAIRGADGPAPVLLQALFAREGGAWRLVALAARPADAAGAPPAVVDEARLAALRLTLGAAGR